MPAPSPEPSFRPPVRLLFIQTQAEMAGAQEISRLVAEGLAARVKGGRPEFEIHHLFFYRKTRAFDGWPNVHFCAERSPKNPVAFASFFARLVRTIRRIAPDVLIPFQHYGNIFGALAGRLAGVPVIVANHVSAPGVINAPTRALDRLVGLAGAYDRITVNSHATLRDYRNYPPRYSNRLVHVPHGFARRTADLDRQAARAAFGLPADAPLLGSVARLHPMKQLDAAIRLLPLRPRWHLAIAGQGVDGPRLAALAEELGVAARTHFTGDMPPAEVGRFLAALDVFVFPSLAESFGLAAVEAAQAGLPVVANDLPVLREVLDIDGEPCALFVEAADVEAFAAAVDRLFDEPGLAERLGALGRRLGERYSVEAMVDAYAELIREGLLAAGRMQDAGLRGRLAVARGR